jgi:hypothetical protein
VGLSRLDARYSSRRAPYKIGKRDAVASGASLNPSHAMASLRVHPFTRGERQEWQWVPPHVAHPLRFAMRL